MKSFLNFFNLLLLFFILPSCKDNTVLIEPDSNDEILEAFCGEMNDNFLSLHKMLSAMENGDCLANVSVLIQNDNLTGYCLTFSEYGNISFHYGRDYQLPLLLPEFGVMKDTDGVYYWQLNGNWIIDENANKLSVTSADVTPRLRVENNMYFVSYDKGKSWENLTTVDVPHESNGLFKDITLAESTVSFTMADGGVLTVPIGEHLQLLFGDFDAESIQYGVDLVIPYTIMGARSNVIMYVLSDSDMFDAEVIEDSETSGSIIITQKDFCNDEMSGKIEVFVTSEDGTTLSKEIRLLSGALYSISEDYDNTYFVDAASRKFEFTVATNRDFEVKTNDDWIFCTNTKAIEDKVIDFSFQANEGARRKTYVEISSGDICFGFNVVQKGYCNDFAVNVSCNKIQGGSWTVGLDTLYNTKGQTINEVLGYYSWSDMAQAMGDYNDLVNRKGEVKWLAYDLYTGNSLPYDNHLGVGFFHDKEGNVMDSGTNWENCVIYWDIDSLGANYIAFRFGIQNVHNIYTGETCSFGLLFKSPFGEARVEITIDVVEYPDPEKGLYDTPALPGRYEFTIRDTVDVGVVNSIRTNNAVAEIIKSTLGMTTYEIFKASFTKEYRLKDNTVYVGDYLGLDESGCCVSNGSHSQIANVYWRYGAYPEDMYMSLEIPVKSGNESYSSAVYNAVGQTVIYDYVLHFEDYELVFTHEIAYIGESNIYGDYVRLDYLRSFVDNTEKGTSSITLNLITDGLDYSVDPSTGYPSCHGDGYYLTLEVYSSDGKILPGVYKVSSVGEQISDGEFAAGWTSEGQGEYGAGLNVRGTCLYVVKDCVTTIEKIEDGVLTISKEGLIYTVTLESSVVKADYVGNLPCYDEMEQIWENDGSVGSSHWSSIYRFAPETNSTGEEVYAVPIAIWEKMKKAPFMVQFKPDEGSEWLIRITDGWWSVGNDGTSDVTPAYNGGLVDNFDGTLMFEVDLAVRPDLVAVIDSQHLLFTGSGFTIQRLFFIKR